MAKMTEMTITDLATGEILAEKTFFGSRSKGGWCMLYQQKGFELIATAPSASVLKVFMYLACGQTYVGGMKTTKRAVEQNLGLSHKTVALAFDWLKEHLVIHEWRVDGCTEFLINPLYVCIGNFDDRLKLWNQRWGFKNFFSSPSYQRKKQKQFEQQLKGG